MGGISQGQNHLFLLGFWIFPLGGRHIKGNDAPDSGMAIEAKCIMFGKGYTPPNGLGKRVDHKEIPLQIPWQGCGTAKEGITEPQLHEYQDAGKHHAKSCRTCLGFIVL